MRRKLMKNLVSFTFGIILFLGLTSQSAGQLIEKKTVSLDLAKKIAAVAETEAIKNNLSVVVAIVDDGGNLVYLEKMDNAQLGSINIAIDKAKTSVLFKRPSKAYEEKVSAGNNAILGLKEVLPFEGGIPLVISDQIVGAVGASGGSPQQDGMIAKAAIDYFQSLKF
jgi:glc operon protein GlcG